MRKCVSCGGENESDAEYCTYCGKELLEPGVCPECGIANPPEAKMCRMCGAGLAGESSTPRAAPSEKPGYRVKYQTCAKCGHRLGATQIECPACGYGSPFYEPKASRTLGLPMAAGVLLFIAGMINIFWGIIIGDTYGHYYEGVEQCAMIEIILGVVAIPAAFLSMMRRLLPFVMVASVLTLATLGPFFVCSLCGFSAIVLLIVSAKEFD